MLKQCSRCNGRKFLVDGRCEACNRRTALNYYYKHRESLLAANKARREEIKAILAAHSKKTDPNLR